MSDTCVFSDNGSICNQRATHYCVWHVFSPNHIESTDKPQRQERLNGWQDVEMEYSQAGDLTFKVDANGKHIPAMHKPEFCKFHSEIVRDKRLGATTRTAA